MADITKNCTISTCHVKNETIHNIRSGYLGYDYPLTVYPKRTYGWIIHIPDKFDLEDIWADIPEDLQKCIEFAIENGCEWLTLDRDGVVETSLPAYDW